MDKNLPDLQIPKALLDKIIEHSVEEYPLECCGILAGKGGKIVRLLKMKNIEESPFSYLLDPEEQFKVFHEIEEQGLEVSAIYHSHPHSPAYPSSRDIDLAFYPESQIWIISLTDPQDPQMGAFQIEAGKVRKKEIRVLPEN